MSDGKGEVSDQEIESAIADVLLDLMERSRAEQKTTPGWATLWEANAGDGVAGLLDAYGEAVRRARMDATEIIRESYGVRPSPRLYDLVAFYPIVLDRLQSGIHDEQGMTCCVDKARHVYRLAIVEEIDRIRQGGAA